MIKIRKKSIYLKKIKKLEIKEEIRKINKNELLVKVDSCGVCSSDLKFIYTGSRIKKFPLILGHEISGTIGNNKHIIFGAEIPCKKCPTCKNKKLGNLCDNPKSVGSNFDGGFSNYFVIKKSLLRNIPHIIYKNKKILKYASLAESLACVINGLELTNFKKGSSIVIIGAGYMGLLFTALSKIKKAKQISVIDFDKRRLKIARELGANNTFKPSLNDKNLTKKIIKLSHGKGYDAVISANNNVNSHNLACNLVAKGGYVNIFGGVPKNKSNKISIDVNFIHYRQAFISGSFSSNQTHLNKAFRIIKNNSIDFSKIITSYANFNNFMKKIKLLKNRKEIKVLFKPV